MLPVARSSTAALGRIVQVRTEHGHVAPEGLVVAVHPGAAEAEFELQLVVDAPGVLAEELEHVAAVRGVGARTDFRVGREQAESRVGHAGAGAGSAAGTDVVELEAAVLVVGAAGNARHVDLVEVVLAGALEEPPNLNVWLRRSS
jgi:hypothetical protein